VTTLVWLAASSLVWGAVLWGAAMALQSGNDLSGRARQWVWRGAAVLLIIPWLAVPVVGVLAPDLSGSIAPPVAVSEELASFEEPAFYEAPVAAEGIDATSIQPAVIVDQGIATPWIEIIVAVVIGGWLLRGIVAGQAARRLGRIIAESRPGEGASLATLARWSRTLGLRKAPELRVVSATTSPFSTGVTKPLVCLPEGIEQTMQAETLDLVVGHECIHVARGDGWRRPLERSIADIMWFNPFAWAIRRELDLARELACDEAVVAASSQRRAYARTLRIVAGMVSALPASAPAASMSLSGGGRVLAMRMKRTLDAAARRPAKAAVVGAVMLAFAATPMAIAQAVLIEAVQPPDAPPAPPAPPAPAAVAEFAQAPLPPAAPSVAVPAQAPTPPVAPKAPGYVQMSSGGDVLVGVASRVVEVGGGQEKGYRVRLLQTSKNAEGQTCGARLDGLSRVVVAKDQVLAKGAVIGERSNSSGLGIAVVCSDETDASGWPVGGSQTPVPPAPPVPLSPSTPEVTPTPPTPPIPPTLERIQFSNGATKLEGAPSAVIAAPGRLMSGYGYRTDPFNQNTAFHQGVDIEAPRGTAVHTPGPGVVAFAGVRAAYGRVVEVALDDDHKIHFSHLNEIAVVQGEALEAGDIVGTVGSTGRSSGPHLHLEFYRNGNSVDPLTVQGLTLTAGRLSTLPAFPTPEPIRFAPTPPVTTPPETRAPYDLPPKLEGAPSAVVDAPARRTSTYGPRVDPFSRNVEFHEGIDIAKYFGAPIHAPGNGVVAYTGVKSGHGRVIELELAGGFMLRFSHLSSIDVKTGDKVKAGDVIAAMGSSGTQAGPHLHFEVHLNGKSYDPETIQGLILIGPG
jgi:murein DD-endopeptidase MepM/ murein hydrolase activator NlpD/beta-lactamase regulating signal transducer with metallopeptidase domain